VQLHGSETPERCQVVREKAGVPVWKAIPGDVAGAEVGYEAAVDALLLDSGKGGTGRILDWAAIVARFPRAERTIPVLLAGGLGPDNIAQAIDAARPDGVDASSRLEQRPGAKDPRLVHAYVLRARAAARAAADSDLAKAPW
jgi:phosphoribosylanthranilate isomerase